MWRASQKRVQTSHLMSQNSVAILEKLALDESENGRVWFHRSRNTGTPFHRHAELEVNLVASGHATYLVGNRQIRLARRGVLWLFPAQDHVLIEQSSDFSMWILVWKPEFLKVICRADDSQILLRQNPGEIFYRRIEAADSGEIETICRRNIAQKGDGHSAGLSYLLFLLWEAFRSGTQSVVGGTVHPAVERAARLLRDQNPPPSVPVLARQVGLSPSRLSRLFGAQTGLCLTDFRAAQCLNRALRLCDDPALSLSEIAARAGFGSYAQFHRIFRARTGQSPAQHRRSSTAERSD